MEKRTVLVIALSLLILMTWSALMPKPQPIVNKEVATQVVGGQKVCPQAIATPVPKIEPSAEKLFKYAQERFDVTFIEQLGAIKEVTFKAHQNYTFPLRYGFLLDGTQLEFKKESVSADAVTFVRQEQDKKIIKRFIFSKSSYDIWLELSIQNLSNTPLKFSTYLVLGALDLSSQNIQSRYQDAIISGREKTQHLNIRKAIETQEVNYIGFRDRYFCAILDPDGEMFGGFIKKINAQESEIGVKSADLLLNPGQQIGQKFHIYLGPQDLKTISAIKPDWGAIINFGTFDFISQILLQLLEFLYRLVHSWGWAIVILSLIVYFALYPLTLKQMRSMKEMQAVQPKIEELRKIYKDNPQKLNKEIMELYREHKVNPLGGCLPLVLQMPIFFALYQALMRSIALKGASFLWIKDLSEPDRLFILPKTLPVIGNEFNILPVLMAIGMFIQQKFTMASASSAAAEQQKLMTIFMPILFGIIFYHMPSGLVLYWFVNSTLMLVYQIRISRSR